MAWAMSAPLGRLLPLEGDDHLPDRLDVRRLLDLLHDDLFENVPGEDVADRLAVLPLQAGVLLVQPFVRPADVAEDLFQRTPFEIGRASCRERVKELVGDVSVYMLKSCR